MRQAEARDLLGCFRRLKLTNRSLIVIGQIGLEAARILHIWGQSRPAIGTLGKQCRCPARLSITFQQLAAVTLMQFGGGEVKSRKPDTLVAVGRGGLIASQLVGHLQCRLQNFGGERGRLLLDSLVGLRLRVLQAIDPVDQPGVTK